MWRMGSGGDGGGGGDGGVGSGDGGGGDRGGGGGGDKAEECSITQHIVICLTGGNKTLTIFTNMGTDEAWSEKNKLNMIEII